MNHTIRAQSFFVETRNNVGDIPFDPELDDPEFVVLDEYDILPYNTKCRFLIEGERDRVVNYFEENFTLPSVPGLSGYITIRFLVNYKGQTDRFRIYTTDPALQPFEFPGDILNTLLNLTKNLDGWITEFDQEFPRRVGLPVEGKENKYVYDYYQYILFKIKDGKLETILP